MWAVPQKLYAEGLAAVRGHRTCRRHRLVRGSWVTGGVPLKGLSPPCSLEAMKEQTALHTHTPCDDVRPDHRSRNNGSKSPTD